MTLHKPASQIGGIADGAVHSRHRWQSLVWFDVLIPGLPGAGWRTVFPDGCHGLSVLVSAVGLPDLRTTSRSRIDAGESQWGGCGCSAFAYRDYRSFGLRIRGSLCIPGPLTCRGVAVEGARVAVWSAAWAGRGGPGRADRPPILSSMWRLRHRIRKISGSPVLAHAVAIVVLFGPHAKGVSLVFTRGRDCRSSSILFQSGGDVRGPTGGHVWQWAWISGLGGVAICFLVAGNLTV